VGLIQGIVDAEMADTGPLFTARPDSVDDNQKEAEMTMQTATHHDRESRKLVFYLNIIVDESQDRAKRLAVIGCVQDELPAAHPIRRRTPVSLIDEIKQPQSPNAPLTRLQRQIQRIIRRPPVDITDIWDW
jgi:hypothetical protein